jgi:Pyruvate/2-oxoacid:ferredoxin oxidoreductase delta subunit
MQTIKEVIIFYFSGTGNAKQIASWFAEFARKKGCECTLVNMQTIDTKSIASYPSDTLFVIISPIHGFNYPKITLGFLSRFPKGNHRVVLMNTRAGMRIGRWVTPGLTGIAFLVSSLILKIKHYHIVGQIPFDMPSNWIFLHPALREKTVKYIYKVNYARVEKHADKIFSGKSDFIAYRSLLLDVLISPIAVAYFLIGQFGLAKTLYASSACDHCGLCIKQCPRKAIKSLKGRPFWTFKCENCMKCINNCPKKAIEAGQAFFIITGIISSMITTALFNYMFFFELSSEFIHSLLSTVIFFLFLVLFYRLQHLLLRFSFTAKIISFLSLTHYKFWGRYKSIPDHRWKE